MAILAYDDGVPWVGPRPMPAEKLFGAFRERRSLEKTPKHGLHGEAEASLARPSGVGRQTFVSTERSWLQREQMELAEYSSSGLRAGEDMTSLHREEIARALNTAKDRSLDISRY
jgi:hypothetical protein